MLLSEQEARAICDKLLGAVKADDAQVSVTSVDHSHLRFAANAFRTSGRRADIQVGVTVWVDKKKGSASTNAMEDASLRAAVEQAESLALVSPVDPEYLPTLGPQRYRETVEYVEQTANLPLEERAKSVADIIAACEKNDVTGAGFHQARGAAEAGATKQGNFHYHRSSLASLGVTARTREGGGSGYFLRNHFDLLKLDTARIGREAIRKALDSRQARALSAGTCTVILEPQAVADLLSFVAFAFDARQADEGRSPFSAREGKNKLGERMFDERINILSDPWRPELPGRPVAQDGIPAERFYLVRNGVTENLTYTRFWAREKRREPSPGPVNVIIEGSGRTAGVAEMIENTKKGLLVTRFWYIRPVDPRTATVTGLTRDGVWYVEDGKVQYPVRNFRFNQSLIELLGPGNVEMIGEPERAGSSEAQGSFAALMPALKAKQFHFTSQSEAV